MIGWKRPLRILLLAFMLVSAVSLGWDVLLGFVLGTVTAVVFDLLDDPGRDHEPNC